MNKLLLIALNEYKHRTARKSFIIILLAPLLIIVFSVIIGYFSATSALKSDKGIVGYVDPSGAMAHAMPPPVDADNTFQRYPDRASADDALRSQHIIAYFSLAANFTSTGQADFYYWQFKPGKQVMVAFDRFVRTALVDGTDAAVTQRLLSGSHYVLSTPDGSRTFSDNDVFAIVLPLVVSGLFIIALFGGASYLLQAVVDEKENRTMEIIITSVTPMQLMSGKIIGLAAVALTQVGVWLAAGTVALQLVKTKFDFMQNARVDPLFIVIAIVFSMLQYLLYGAFMAAIGSVVLDAKQGQSWSSPVIITGMLPMFFFGVILFDPNGTLAVILSLFPLTAPLALILRYNMTSVPIWQIGVAFVLLVLSVAGAMWMASRVFRFGMLRYGQTIKLAEIASHIRF
jgi:ABC-2 type transport system permease protein